MSLKRNDKVFCWLLEKRRWLSSPVERSKPLAHLEICLGVRKDLPRNLSQSNKIDCIISWFKRGRFLNGATICEGEVWNDSNPKHWNTFSILKATISQPLRGKMMGWKQFKILELGLPDWACKRKMHCQNHLSILKGVKFSHFPLCLFFTQG